MDNIVLKWQGNKANYRGYFIKTEYSPFSKRVIFEVYNRLDHYLERKYNLHDALKLIDCYCKVI